MLEALCPAQATLEEVRQADLLLHVLDASSPHIAHQRLVVQEVLRFLGISPAAMHNQMIEVGKYCISTLNSQSISRLGLHAEIKAACWLRRTEVDA